MTDWLQYEWEWKGARALFAVDLQYWELLPSLAYSKLVFVNCSPLRPNAEQFTRKEQRRIAALEKELRGILLDSAIFVGSITLPNVVQFYFYAQDNTLLEQVSVLSRAETKLTLRYGTVTEPRYSSYYRLLFPDDAKLQSVENALFIHDVHRKGVDLDAVRRVRLSLAFPSPEQRRAFFDAVPQGGFTVGGSYEREHPSHPCIAVVTGFCCLQLPALNRFTARAIRAAVPFEGMPIDIDAELV